VINAPWVNTADTLRITVSPRPRETAADAGLVIADEFESDFTECLLVQRHRRRLHPTGRISKQLPDVAVEFELLTGTALYALERVTTTKTIEAAMHASVV